jgi:hypothetical protein
LQTAQRGTGDSGRLTNAPAPAGDASSSSNIKEECLNRVIPFWERRLRRAIDEFVAHYHGERNHQGIGNELIDRQASMPAGQIRRRQRLGGLFSYYYRAA